jgi:putative phage-type endonuclease
MITAGTPEWLEARRRLITATDLPAILGIDPWRSEGDVARAKLEGAEPEPTIPMRVGSTLEPLIAALWSERTGEPVERWGELVTHPELPWAGATPDYRAGDVLVECKWSATPSRWRDGLPQEYECQVRWQLGVTGLRRASVAALVGRDLSIYDVEHDEDQWRALVRIAEDFRRRLEAGGPFAETRESIARAYPRGEDIELVADRDLADAVRALLDVRSQIERLKESADRLETTIKGRMGPASRLVGEGFVVTWRNVRDSEITDWRAVATALLRSLPEQERAELIRQHTTTKPGVRRFIVRGGDEDGD